MADRFDDLGAGLFAAEAAAQASHAARAAGDHQMARRWATRAEELVADLGPVATPALELRAEVVRLTDREREVAALAARRVPSKEIAAQLHAVPPHGRQPPAAGLHASSGSTTARAWPRRSGLGDA